MRRARSRRSFTSGGKVVNVDRVIFENIADERPRSPRSAPAEIDMIELPNVDLLDTLLRREGDQAEVLNKQASSVVPASTGSIRRSTTSRARQAMLYLIHHTEVMKATLGDEKYFKGCSSLFGMGTPMANDAISTVQGWPEHREGQAAPQRNPAMNGRPVGRAAGDHIASMNNAADLMRNGCGRPAQTSHAGVDWGPDHAPRRQGAARPGRRTSSSLRARSTAFRQSHRARGPSANGEKGWFGGRTDEKHEASATKWASRPMTPSARRSPATCKQNAWDFVPHMYYGQWFQPSALRNLTG